MIFAVTFVIGIGASLMVASLRTNGAAGKALMRISARSQLADRFRADVATATSAAPADNSLRLTLRDDKKEQVTYRWHDGAVERIEETDGTATPPQTFNPGSDCQSVEFLRSDDRPNLLTLRFTDSEGKERPVTTLDITADLGGDLK
jgi:hypothetical protein